MKISYEFPDVDDWSRRGFLKHTLLCGAVASFGYASASAVEPAIAPVLTEDKMVWPAAAFDDTRVNDIIKQLYGTLPKESAKVVLDIPVIAEISTSVPLTAWTSLKDVSAISILVVNNLNPLVAHYAISPHIEARIATRIKIAVTSNVIAVVRTPEGVFMAKEEVKIVDGDECV